MNESIITLALAALRESPTNPRKTFGDAGLAELAELLQAGVPEMRAQLEMAEQLIERFKRTGRVGFNGAEYQLAKDGIGYMDQLAEIVDQRTAIEAADWSEHHLAGLRHGANPCTCATPSGPDYCPEHAA